MARLRDRNRFIPGGFRFLQPQIPRWSITPWVSFDTAVQQIIQMRKANPLISSNHGLSTDPATVAGELDAFNAKICSDMGWAEFIWEGGGEPPASPKVPSLLQRLKQSAARVAAGAASISEWQIEGGELVPQEEAEARAKICVGCPKNESGDLTSWFTVPAADLIKAQLEKRNEQKIRTSVDPLLGVCTACACPLKLKCHVPINIILLKMSAETKMALDARCWILAEEKGPKV